ncbi:MAG: hypothetical protein RL264_2019 [Bacteroidota bacterium]|jgi:cell division septation protein DedD
MLSIENTITQLLIRHSCVILPELGGFVAQPVSARIDRQTGIMHPPSKQLLFNINLLHNDGLLISEWAKENKFDYSQAQTAIFDYVSTIRLRLGQGQEVELGQIGKFYLNSEKTLCFEQNSFFNLLISAYGLVNVSFVPASTETAKESVQIELTPESQVENETPIISIQRKNRAWIKYAAAAIIALPLAFYSVWIPTQTDVLQSGILNSKELNPFYKTENSVYVKKQLPKIVPIPKELEIVKETTKTQAQESITETSNEVEFNSKQVHYIVGCFASASNAEKLVNDLRSKGFDSRIVPGGKLIRVSAGFAKSIDNLQPIIQKAASSGLEGWIMK